MRARRATSADARELVRLRHVMFTSLGPTPSDDRWMRRCLGAFAERLAHDPSFAAFVIGVPGSGPLLSCAVGEYTRRLPSPRSTAANLGHVHSVITNPTHRRNGHGRACLIALLQWLAEHDCSHVQLRASAEGHALYEQLGFNTVDDAHMVWMPPTA
ncbi:GNAT family N-acetyltransferase [Streptomyces solisilvae]|uniref:GNAT family N-acetyltransferase n=2 Tax=Streptomyces malaysiensis TaxID=92644 RepID=UPI00368B3D24